MKDRILPIQFRVLTLNLLNIADRWPERRPLLRDAFAELRPEIAGLQEVFYPVDQDRLVAATTGRDYLVRRAWADREERGNSLLVAAGIGSGLSGGRRLALDHGRSAVVAVLRLGERSLRLVVTHLHHIPGDEGIRERQVTRLVDQLGRSKPTDATVILGDFNAEPDEAAALRMADAGYRSAYYEANGSHPDMTFPSGLEAPDRDYYIGWPTGAIDYIWLAGGIRAVSAELCFERPAPDDPTLYASDHRGVVAELLLA